MAKAMVKRSKLGLIIKFIFWSIILLIIATFSLLYFGKNINAFTLYSNASGINASYSVEENNLDTAYDSLNYKLSDTADKKLFNGDEISAYINRNESFQGFDFISLTCDDEAIIITVKYDASELSQLSFIDKKVPDEIYLEIKSKISGNGESFDIKNDYTKISNLSIKKSRNLVNYYNLFKKQINSNKITKKVLDMITSNLFSGEVYGFSYEKSLNESFFSVYYAPTTKKGNISYTNTKDAENNNPTEYTVVDEVFMLNELVCDGYKFEGWYDEENLKVEYIDTAYVIDYVLEARWSIVKYTITYDLNFGTISSAPTEYTIEDEDIEIPQPTREFAEFVGWDDGSGEYVLDYVIKHGSTGNITLTAMFEGEVNNVTLYGNGMEIDSFEISKGVVLTEEYLNNNIDLSSFGGYTINEWYIDSDMTTLYTYDKSIKMDFSLYGDLEYIYESNIFKYIDSFNNAQISKTLTITSDDMLKSFVEYVYITQLKTKINVSIPYAASAAEAMSNMDDEIGNTLNWNWRPSVGGSTSSAVIYFSGKADNIVNIMDPTGEESYIQEDYALYQYATSRADDFNDFNRLKVNKNIEVSNTTSLVYALELGYNPICSGKALEIINLAKKALREIIDDDMSDVEKLKQIYVWTMINTSYDYKAANSTIEASQKITYKSWFAEGVFEDGRVVCEGYAKAVTILSCLENIPSVVVTGDGHAWNRVYVNSNWYVLDATHGDQPIGIDSGVTYEIVSFDQFLITDSYKTSLGYTSEKFSSFICNTQFDYFNTITVTYGGSTVNLLISSATQADVIINYIKNNKYVVSGSKYRTFEVAFNTGYTLAQFQSRAKMRGLSVKTAVSIKSFETYNTAYSIILS